MRPLLTALCLGFAAISVADAETITWKNVEGSSSFTGEYLTHDERHVTIRREDGRVFTLEIERLHRDHREWLDERGAADEPPPNPNAVFDTLIFGDTRKEVEAKLRASETVEPMVDETFLGRFGLNGTFRTVRKIGGLHGELYFAWTNGGKLDEVSLRTEPLDGGSYATRLRDNWRELAGLLTTLHGRALQSNGFPDRGELRNDLFLASHIWRLDGGGTAMLGSSMLGDQYRVVVRFTTANLKPVRVP